MLAPEAIEKIRRATVLGPDAPRLRDRVQLLQEVRALAPEASELIDRQVLREIARMDDHLTAIRQAFEDLREEHERLTSPPWQIAVFRRWHDVGRRALVSLNGRLRMVTCAASVVPETLQLGDDVYLNDDLNVLLERSPWGGAAIGETAEFVRCLSDGRIVVRSREEEIVVDARPSLVDQSLEEGDLIRWNRDLHLAYERIDRSVTERHFLGEVPDVTEAVVGGQRSALEAIKGALLTTLVAPDKAARYALQRRQSVMLVGPPGCGKTLMARVAAAEIQRISGKKCYFAVVKPSEWEDPFVGVTAANIRKAFEAFRKKAEEGNYVVVFLDEIESIGRIRGHAMGYHGDKHTAALLAEIDGFAARGGVAIVTATNRKDLIDPALLERLSDVEVFVPRPNLEAAGEIFRIHLNEDLPFSPNGAKSEMTRSEIIDVAVSQIYGPNAENKLSTVKFRDGSQRSVAARDLMSGRLIEQICKNVRQRAFVRDVQSGEVGIRVSDIEEAITEALQRLSTTLTIHNVRSYLTDLPQDVDVVGVEPVRRRVEPAHRLLNREQPSGDNTAGMGV